MLASRRAHLVERLLAALEVEGEGRGRRSSTAPRSRRSATLERATAGDEEHERAGPRDVSRRDCSHDGRAARLARAPERGASGPRRTASRARPRGQRAGRAAARSRRGGRRAGRLSVMARSTPPRPRDRRCPSRRRRSRRGRRRRAAFERRGTQRPPLRPTLRRAAQLVDARRRRCGPRRRASASHSAASTMARSPLPGPIDTVVVGPSRPSAREHAPGRCVHGHARESRRRRARDPVPADRLGGSVASSPRACASRRRRGPCARWPRRRAPPPPQREDRRRRSASGRAVEAPRVDADASEVYRVRRGSVEHVADAAMRPTDRRRRRRSRRRASGVRVAPCARGAARVGKTALAPPKAAESLRARDTACTRGLAARRRDRGDIRRAARGSGGWGGRGPRAGR